MLTRQKCEARGYRESHRDEHLWCQHGPYDNQVGVRTCILPLERRCAFIRQSWRYGCIQPTGQAEKTIDWSKFRQFAPDEAEATADRFVCTVWTLIGPTVTPLICGLRRIVERAGASLARNGEIHRSQLRQKSALFCDTYRHFDDTLRD